MLMNSSLHAALHSKLSMFMWCGHSHAGAFNIIANEVCINCAYGNWNWDFHSILSRGLLFTHIALQLIPFHPMHVLDTLPTRNRIYLYVYVLLESVLRTIECCDIHRSSHSSIITANWARAPDFEQDGGWMGEQLSGVSGGLRVGPQVTYIALSR